MEAYTLTGQAKIEGVCEFLENLIDNGAKFLVYAHHIQVLDALEDFAKKQKVGYIRIDGSKSAEARHESVKNF